MAVASRRSRRSVPESQRCSDRDVSSLTNIAAIQTSNIEFPKSMSSKSKTDYLRNHLDTQIDEFNARRRRDKKKAVRAKVVQASAGAAVTVILGLDNTALGFSTTTDARLKTLALFLSAAVTIVAAWDAFFDHRSLWIRYAGVLAGLRAIRAELEYLTSDPDSINETELDGLFRRTQALLESANLSWQQLRAAERQPTANTQS
jgi:hypothetical protein